MVIIHRMYWEDMKNTQVKSQSSEFILKIRIRSDNVLIIT